MDIIIPYASWIFIGGLIAAAIGGILVACIAIYIVLGMRIKND